MRVAFFLSMFPVISETFILRQITGLLDLGHDVDIYAQRSPEGGGMVHLEVVRYSLLERTTYLDKLMPVESGYWSMPVWPISGQTWLPGAETPIENFDRILRAVPTLQKCLSAVPALTIRVLDPGQYGTHAISLESLYSLAALLERRAEYDVLHCHFGPTANAFRFLRELWEAPLVVTFHGYDFSVLPRACGSDVYRHLFQDADLVMAVSESARAKLEQLGCERRKLRVLRTGLDPAEFEFRARQPRPGQPVRLLSVARLVEKKGIEYALRAVHAVRPRHPNLSYEVIGDGPRRPALEALIRELDLGAVVTLHGAKDIEFVRARMGAADLFVLPSVTAADGDQEGIPVSLMEAQACGLPVLSTWHSGIPELVADGRSGLLVPERDVEALAERLQYLLAHPEIWPELGREGRKIVEAQVNISSLSSDLIRLYEEAIAAFNRQRAKYGIQPLGAESRFVISGRSLGESRPRERE